MKNIVLYSGALCNLQCRYCYIDKNTALKEIDYQLEKSFADEDYYYNFAKEICTDKDKLEVIEVWGAETMISMHRIIPTYIKMLGYFPNLNTFSTSTNFCSDNVMKELFSLLNIYKEFPERKFTFKLQISIDGDEELNDASRGIGVTKKIINNFDTLLSKLEEVPNNVKIRLSVKQTLDTCNWKNFLDKSYIIKYYKFFEDNFIDKVRNLHSDKVEMFCGRPNLAVPYNFTQEDGKLFYEISKALSEIENENRANPIFKYYQRIMMYSLRNKIRQNNNIYFCGGTCGSGIEVIGLLPGHMLSACHRSFVDLCEEYKKISANRKEQSIISDCIFNESFESPFIFYKDDLSKYQRRMELFYKPQSCALIVNQAILIQQLAISGQIDKKYNDINIAIEVSQLLTRVMSPCIRNNMSETGLLSVSNTGKYKLLLNGAIDLICKKDLIYE